MRCMLIGNYGVGNLGDEALKDFFVATFPHIEWVILSANSQTPNEMARLPMGIRSLISFRWRNTLKQLKSCDAVVFGGGSLFTDVESVRACFLWGVHAWAAHRKSVPIYLAFQGIGPFRTRIGERIARIVCGWATFMSVRDVASFNRVQSWNLNKKVVQTYDPILLTINSQNTDRSKKVLTIIPRYNSSNSFAIQVSTLLHKDSWDEVHVLSMEPDSPSEQTICDDVESLADGKTRIVPVRTMSQLIDEVSRSSYVLTHRFHGAIAALGLGVPFEAVHQGEGDKLYEIERMQRNPGAAEELKRLAQRGVEALEESLRK